MKLKTFLFAGLAVVATSVLAVQGQVPGVNSTLNTVFTLAYDNATMKQTYSATRLVPAVSTLTNVCTLTGSSTKQVRLRRVIVNGIGTAVLTEPVQILKYSALMSGGAGALMVNVPYDSANGAATAVADIWTTSPTVGTFVGALADVLYTWGNLTTGVGAPPLVFTFGQLGQSVVLRSASQYVAVDLGGVTNAAAQLTCTFEWTEE